MTSVTRLIQYFKPNNYSLAMDINEQAKTFSGRVVVTGEVQPDADHIGLHAKDLTITSVLVDDTAAEFTQGKDDELVITSPKITPGNHAIAVEFNSSITDPMHGLYPCYFTSDGVKKMLFATQLESHHAREVFPCIDEPSAKATFDLSLTTNKDQSVLSNMPAESTEETDDRQVTTFETTPRMSPYLLAFVVGELHKKSATTKDGVEVNVWSTPVQPAKNLDFALEIAVRSIEFYEEYFGTKYPLPKSDHVALPDFTVGAMENWGLITYRETALLAHPKSTSIVDKRRVASVIVHELAHQWFGNLVTMEWWNDLWLNESFANLMQYVSIDALHPEWDIWLDYVTTEPTLALRRDSIDGVQSVQVDVSHPDEISTLFDSAIVYAKGGRLLRMIQQYIGDDAFRAGLKQYFTDYAYGNTVGDDLWNALEAASGKQIKAIMNTWITQPGYPVVTLTRDNDSLTLTQKQFFIGPHRESGSTWPLPLNSRNPELPELLNEHSTTVPMAGPVQLNLKDSSHYITNYDEISKKALLQQVADGSLDPIARIQLLHEATLLARGGVISTADLLPILEAYKNEPLEPVWEIIGAVLSELRKFVEDDEEAERKLRQLSATMANKEYVRLGWTPHEGEAEEDTKLRSIILSLTLYGEAPDAIATAQKFYETTKLEDLDPEIRPLVISTVARYGDAKVVDDLMVIHNNSSSGTLRKDISVGVTSTRVPEKISQLLDSMKNADIIRPQDVFRWFIFLIKGRESRTLAWRWIRDNWDWVEATFKGDMSYDDYPRYSANGLVTTEELEEYKTFFEPMKAVPALTRTIAMGISEIEGRVEHIKRDKIAVQEALLALPTPE